MEVEQFWGLAGYYRRYIKDFASIAHPLNTLLRTDVSFNWTKSTERSFLTLKKWLSYEPVLVYQNFETMSTLCTDASSQGLGAVLEQSGHAMPLHIIVNKF